MDNYKLQEIANACNMTTEKVKKIMQEIALEEIAKRKIADEKEVKKMANALTK